MLIVDRDNKLPLRALQRLLQRGARRWEAGIGRVLRHEDQQPPARGLDLGRRRRPRHPARARALRRGLRPAVTEIRHAFRVTVRATNGYVYPASHTRGVTTGALPMGARLRLKAGKDISRLHARGAEDLPRDEDGTA